MMKLLLSALLCILLATANAQLNNALLKDGNLPTNPTASSRSQVIFTGYGEFSLGLRTINPYLRDIDIVNVSSGAACANRDPWEHCANYIGLFSGLTTVKQPTVGGPITFLGITDRGPNVECADFTKASNLAWGVVPDASSVSTGQSFTVPKFSPSFFKLVLDVKTNNIEMKQSCYIKDSSGNAVTGLPNNDGLDNSPWLSECLAPGQYQKAGVDSEDIAELPTRGLIVVSEEYSSIFITKGFASGKDCGQIIARYVPVDSPLTTESANVPIHKVLPAYFSTRRKNRGLENLAVLKDETTLLAMLQSNTNPNTSPLTTAIMMDITEIDSPSVIGVYKYLTDRAESGNTQWLDSTLRAKDIKLSGFAPVSHILGLPEDYPIVLAIERATNQVKIYLVDFSDATDVSWNIAQYDIAGYVNTVNALYTGGINVAQKLLVVDSGSISGSPLVDGWIASEKVEGVTVLNDCVLALGTDNDFGYLDNRSSLSIIRLDKCLSELYVELVGDSK